MLAKGLLGVGLPAVVLHPLRRCLAVIPWDAQSARGAPALAARAAPSAKEVARGHASPCRCCGRRCTGCGWAPASLRVLRGGRALVPRDVPLRRRGRRGQALLVPLLHPRPPQPAQRGRAHHHARAAPSSTSSSRAATPSSPGWRWCPAPSPWCPGCACAGATGATHLALIAALWVAFPSCCWPPRPPSSTTTSSRCSPGLAILIALFIDRLWEEGLPRTPMSLALRARALHPRGQGPGRQRPRTSPTSSSTTTTGRTRTSSSPAHRHVRLAAPLWVGRPVGAGAARRRAPG